MDYCRNFNNDCPEKIEKSSRYAVKNDKILKSILFFVSMHIPIIFALLPEDAVSNELINISSYLKSQKILRNYPDYPVLNYDMSDKNNMSEYALPHITLAQAVIESENLDRIKSKIRELEKYRGLKLNVIGKSKGKMSGLLHASIDKNPDMLNLHEDIMELFDDYFLKEWGSNNLAKPINSVTEKWIKDFLPKASRENYNPHITLGEGDFDLTPIQFKASKIALCELGDYCTARKILYHMDL